MVCYQPNGLHCQDKFEDASHSESSWCQGSCVEQVRQAHRAVVEVGVS